MEELHFLDANWHLEDVTKDIMRWSGIAGPYKAPATYDDAEINGLKKYNKKEEAERLLYCFATRYETVLQRMVDASQPDISTDNTASQRVSDSAIETFSILAFARGAAVIRLIMNGDYLRNTRTYERLHNHTNEDHTLDTLLLSFVCKHALSKGQKTIPVTVDEKWAEEAFRIVAEVVTTHMYDFNWEQSPILGKDDLFLLESLSLMGSAEVGIVKLPASYEKHLQHRMAGFLLTGQIN
ncbi:hypothetical protein EJ08DRAFT_654387 [Tothia fuscella]|uniref:Uncharacterized protein n=1 Tax=Tothia fuscella TaxID=1048955 RepID=A0A9P4NEW4_9PEZI|nr:hypothetical protein EJ08DRAFT_654387 [Tothia fuscella]